MGGILCETAARMQRPALTSRLSGFGTSVFAEYTALATKHGAINLGQGYPDFDGPDFVKDAAIAAIRDGRNQYSPMIGQPDLRARRGRAPASASTASPTTRTARSRSTPGPPEAIFSSLAALLERATRWCCSSPTTTPTGRAWPWRVRSARVVTLRGDDFRLEAADLEARDHPAHPGGAAEHAAQPRGQGVHAEASSRSWPRPASATTSWPSPTRSTSTWSSTARTSPSPPCRACASAR